MNRRPKTSRRHANILIVPRNMLWKSYYFTTVYSNKKLLYGDVRSLISKVFYSNSLRVVSFGGEYKVLFNSSLISVHPIVYRPFGFRAGLCILNFRYTYSRDYFLDEVPTTDFSPTFLCTAIDPYWYSKVFFFRRTTYYGAKYINPRYVLYYFRWLARGFFYINLWQDCNVYEEILCYLVYATLRDLKVRIAYNSNFNFILHFINTRSRFF